MHDIGFIADFMIVLFAYTEEAMVGDLTGMVMACTARNDRFKRDREIDPIAST